jgi:phosphatidylglycerophosphate synthase
MSSFARPPAPPAGKSAERRTGESLRDAMRLLPNQISLLRLLSLPVLWGLALEEETVAVGVGAALAGLTDVVDGIVARRTGTTTRIGSALDSVADHLLSASLLAWLVLLRPEFVREQRLVLLPWAAFAAGVLAFGWLKFRRLGGLHLYSAKAASIACYLFAVALLVFGSYDRRVFYAVAGAATAAAAETLAVLLTRREMDEHVGSIFLRRRR